MRILSTHAETYPLVNGKTPVTLLAVLTCGILGPGDKGDTAVYVGTVDLGDYNADPEAYLARGRKAFDWIAANGVKQTLRDARRYFPGLTDSEYRA